ncbi:MAG TPA: VanZ family protein [Cerasibacillus sp.]|uniref:VanZ family protein n=1 Tax=Cerasibacillus sp. TaxID=2498711 RepID=UPI002F43004B
MKIAYWLLPISWMGVIFYASSQPYEKQDIKPMMAEWLDVSFLEPYLSWIHFTYHNKEISVDSLGIEQFIEFIIRKGTHVTVFFILMLLFYYAMVMTTRWLFSARLWVSFLLSVAYAGIDEYHQSFTPNRTAYIGDVIIDSIGAILAGALIWFIYYVKSQKKMTKT